MFLSDIVSRLAPRAEPVIYDALMAIFNFAWYWGISFVVIKIFRAGGWELGHLSFEHSGDFADRISLDCSA